MKLRCIKVDGEVETIAGEGVINYPIGDMRLLVLQGASSEEISPLMLEKLKNALPDPGKYLVMNLPTGEDFSTYRFEADVNVDIAEPHHIVGDDVLTVLMKAHAQYVFDNPNEPRNTTHIARMSFKDYATACGQHFIVDGVPRPTQFLSGMFTPYGALRFVVEDRNDIVIESRAGDAS